MSMVFEGPAIEGRLWFELEQMAMSSHPVELDGDQLVITDHAVRRYRQRVERVARCRARHHLARLLGTAEWEVLPRHWTRVVLYPGTSYGYPAGRPDICLLVRDAQVVVTVLSERFLREQSSAYGRAHHRHR